MPRVNLGRDPVKERQEATRRIIRRGMAEQGFNRQSDIAQNLASSGTEKFPFWNCVGSSPGLVQSR